MKAALCILFQILAMIVGCGTIALRGGGSSSCPPPAIVDPRVMSPYKKDQTCCDLVSLREMREFSMENPGLIIAGAGGSGTRAAQEVVQLAGTHAFGSLAKDTLDSKASRYGHGFAHLREILNATGTLDYKVESLPKKLRTSVEQNTCFTLMILRNMTQQGRTKGKQQQPWALKEPWLRIMLPFYTSMLNIKFLHVTRDMRNIHAIHQHEKLGRYFQDVRLLQTSGDTVMPWNKLSKTLLITENASKQYHFPAKYIRTWVTFAHTWTTMELDLYKSWTQTRPDHYFHLSENKLTNGTTKRSEAIKLAHFLGNLHPDEVTLTKMTNLFRPERWATKYRAHWDLMQAITMEPSSGIIREALATFGYEVYPSEKPWNKL